MNRREEIKQQIADLQAELARIEVDIPLGGAYVFGWDGKRPPSPNVCVSMGHLNSSGFLQTRYGYCKHWAPVHVAEILTHDRSDVNPIPNRWCVYKDVNEDIGMSLSDGLYWPRVLQVFLLPEGW